MPERCSAHLTHGEERESHEGDVIINSPQGSGESHEPRSSQTALSFRAAIPAAVKERERGKPAFYLVSAAESGLEVAETLKSSWLKLSLSLSKPQLRDVPVGFTSTQTLSLVKLFMLFCIKFLSCVHQSTSGGREIITRCLLMLKSKNKSGNIGPLENLISLIHSCSCIFPCVLVWRAN